MEKGDMVSKGVIYAEKQAAKEEKRDERREGGSRGQSGFMKNNIRHQNFS
jgi:hypothetical protein